LRLFRGPAHVRALPSAPAQPVIVREKEDRPQPRRDRDEARGMAVSVGRIRSCPVLDLRFVLVVHNTIRGAAGSAILNGELLKSEGLIG
jgi:aspartate-semialdehyde dehydrogenase